MYTHDYARFYAKLGLRVLPIYNVVIDGNKISCSCKDGEKCEKSIGKHPICRHGCKDATTDLSIIDKWWEMNPNANVGIATGWYGREDGIDGIFCLDIDPRNGGDVSLSNLIEKHGELPLTWTAVSGSGGRHYFFKCKSRVPQSKVLDSGIDGKCRGSYVVASPSNHKSGGHYYWADNPAKMLRWENLAPIPKWILDMKRYYDVLVENSKRDGTIKYVHNFPIPPIIKEGERDNTIFRMACKLLALYGHNFNAIYDEVSRINRDNCRPPLSDGVVRQKVYSALRYH